MGRGGGSCLPIKVVKLCSTALIINLPIIKAINLIEVRIMYR